MTATDREARAALVDKLRACNVTVATRESRYVIADADLTASQRERVREAGFDADCEYVEGRARWWWFAEVEE